MMRRRTPRRFVSWEQREAEHLAFLGIDREAFVKWASEHQPRELKAARDLADIGRSTMLYRYVVGPYLRAHATKEA